MKPSIGFLEVSSIAKGIEAIDVMLKMADVELLHSQAIPRGKFVILINGSQAEVEQSLQAGVNLAHSVLIDSILIPNLHPQVIPAMKARIPVSKLEAVGIIETKEVTATILAADAAVKKAAITLIEVFPGRSAGGKGYLIFTGEVGAVRSAISAGIESISKKEMLVASVVIPYAHPQLLKALL